MQEKVLRVANQDKWFKDKLTELLEGGMTQAAFKKDSEAEEMVEVEESEGMGMEDVGTTGGTQSSAMEVEEEENEVVMVGEVK